MYIEWLPEPFAGEEPGESEFRKALREAKKAAVKWGSLFPVAEARIEALDAAADMLSQNAAVDYFGGGCRKHSEQYDSEYIASHEQFAKALDALAPFIEEPPAPAATAEKKPVGIKQEKRRGRKGVGGRPERYSLKFIREVVAARERDQKHFDKAKKRLPAWAQWLSDYCSGKEINIAEKFPPAFKGEPWQARADRFKKAAKKRLREAETNRH
jgi:hypothetical protein